MTSSSYFADRLVAQIRQKRSCVVVGLDPQVDMLPPHLLATAQQTTGSPFQAVADAFLMFNRAIIDAIASLVVAVKPQIAFYERYGVEGIHAFAETVRYAQQRGLLVIADAKRSDIGSTAAAYADAFLGTVSLGNGTTVPVFDADAVTVNPYLGVDGIRPFIEVGHRYGKGLFVLVRTSNPSAVDLQDLDTPQGRLYQVVGRLVYQWGEGTQGETSYRFVGAVVGATYPDEARILRKLMPRCFFLVPGYGTQGASAQDVVPCFNADGLGAIVNAARSIIYAYRSLPWRDAFTEQEFAQAAAAAAARMRDEINDALAQSGRLPW